MKDDFNINPSEQYGCNPFNDKWDFEKREAEMDKQFDKGLEYKSKVTINLRKQYAR